MCHELTIFFFEHELEVSPNGAVSQSPGLRGTSYPGKTSAENHNPNGVVANVTRASDESGMAATALRLRMIVEQ